VAQGCKWLWLPWQLCTCAISALSGLSGCGPGLQVAAMAALRMCDIPFRKATAPKKVFFFQRGFDRQIRNADDLCVSLRRRRLDSYVDTCDDLPDFCQQIATVHAADIIITVDGSHNHLLAYARPGTVVIFVSGYNFRIPDWKVLSYHAGLRALEYVAVNKSQALYHPGFSMHSVHKSLNATMLFCAYQYNCRVHLRHHDTFVYWREFLPFIDRALEIWNKPDVQECEKPSVWPTRVPAKRTGNWGIWQRNGLENNFVVCEPPAPNCVCCKSEACMEATQVARGF